MAASVPKAESTFPPAATAIEDVALTEATVGEGVEPRTPLHVHEAAERLSNAWREVVGAPLSSEGLAVIWSHWALETGRGERMVGFNFGGLKGEAPEGGSLSLWTRERQEDELTPVRRRFRSYPTAEAGARDYVLLLRQRYPRARRAAERGSVIDFVLGLAERGYFTDDPARYMRAMKSLSREFLEQNEVAEHDVAHAGREI